MDLFLHYLSLPYLLRGIGFTVAVTCLGLAGGLVVGLVLASMQLSRIGPLAAVDELTLRSTQLASSTFDFFSIFFASGLMYLLLTGAVSMIQLFVEGALDLDRSTAPQRFARLLPWRRAGLVAAKPAAMAPADSPAASCAPAIGDFAAMPAKASQPDRAGRYAQ